MSLFIMVKKEVISDGRLNIMGVVGNCQPWKKDNQAMRESGKLDQTGGYFPGGS